MKLPTAFDANTHDPADNYDPLPAGKYEVEIIESEMKTTKNGLGQYLQLTLEVQTGEFKGRRVWDRLNLVNPNQAAVDIANRTLSQICRACGEMNVTDSEQLHYRRIGCKLKVRKATPEFDASNDVAGYFAVSATAPAASGTGTTAGSDEPPF